MGGDKHDGLAIPRRVVLAHEPPFRIGGLKVVPATRQVESASRTETLEPRVMQVLVALARHAGQVVTRDELIEYCWDGRAVGDDAINRVLSRIRQIAAGIGGGRFQLETITKVGYRIVDGDGSGASAGRRAKVPLPASRRKVLIMSGAAAAGAAALAAGSIWRNVGYQPAPSAKLLYEQGIESQLQGVFGTGDQSEAYFRQAVEADPNYADAWGALALAQVVNMGGAPESRLAAIEDRARLAASRALALDADQPEAQLALAILPGFFRRWNAMEADLGAILKRHPRQWRGVAELGLFYANVARWGDAITAFRRARAARPLYPLTVNVLATAYWSAGRFIEAEAESARAVERWPRLHGTWFTRMMILTYGGKPETAAAFAADPNHHPYGTDEQIELRRLTAVALAGHESRAVAEVKSALLTSVERNINSVPAALRLFATLGEVDTCFQLLDGYYFARGRYAPTPDKAVHGRQLFTDFLFYPPSRRLWPDPRFGQLMREIGLDAYWRSIGFVPAAFRA